MKRNMDTIRLLLLHAEGGDEAVAAEYAKLLEPERVEHERLLVEAGLAGAQNAEAPLRLTWAGHDFLDSIRNEPLWRKVKRKVLKPKASWTFDILKAWLAAEIRRRLDM